MQNTNTTPSRIQTLIVPVRRQGNNGQWTNDYAIDVPVIPSSWTTDVGTDGKKTSTIIPPPYVTNIINGNYAAAKDSITREAMLLFLNMTKFKSTGIVAKVGVSAEVPVDHCFLEYFENKIIRIIVNPTQHRAWDSDGDIVIALPGCQEKGNETYLLVKFPITTPPIEFKRWYGKVQETFISIDEEILQQLQNNRTTLSEDELFLKSHTSFNIGSVTNRWNNHELYEGISKGKSYCDTIEDMYRNEDRYNDIEERGLQTARRDGNSTAETVIESHDSSPRMMEPYSSFTISSNGIVKRASTETFLKEDNNGKVTRRDHRAMLHKIKSGSYSVRDFETVEKLYTTMFRNEETVVKVVSEDNGKCLVTTVRGTKNSFFRQREELKPFVRQQQKPAESKIRDINVIYRLLGRNVSPEGQVTKLAKQWLHFKTIPHNILPSGEGEYDGLPLALVIMTDGNGNPVGLTDIKRSDGTKQGITFCYVLPPVWDVKLEQWTHPMEHFNRTFHLRTDDDGNVVSPWDNRVISQRKFSHFIGQRKEDMKTYPVKAVTMMEAITTYCGNYGYAMGAEITQKGQLIPNPIGMEFVKSMVVVDYGDITEPQEMLKAISKVPQRLCISGNKQTDNIRKYACAHSNGTAIYSNEKAHGARSGKIASQMVQASLKMTMTTAIVISGSNQTWITPTGVEKQRTDKVFLPQVYKTQEEVDRAKENNPELEIKEIYYNTITGAKRVAFVGKSRSTISVGKLIEPTGNKTMPSVTQQIYTTEGNPIDLVLPASEVLAKGAGSAIVGDNPEIITIMVPWDGKGQKPEGTALSTAPNGVTAWFYPVSAIVTTMTWYRSGAASENVPTAKKRVGYGCCDGRKIQQTYTAMLGERTDDSTQWIGWAEECWEDFDRLLEFRDQLSEKLVYCTK